DPSFSRGGSREQEVCYVRARYKQNKRDCSHKHHQRQSHVANDLFAEWHHFHAYSLVVTRVTLFEALGYCSHLCLSLLARSVRAEAGDHAQLMITALLIDEIIRQRNRPPQLGLHSGPDEIR